MNIQKFIQEHWYDHKPSKEWYEIIDQLAGENCGTALDIGTASGFSACAIAMSNLYEVISIDPELHDIARKVAKELYCFDQIEFLKMTSDQFFSKNKKKFDFILIDGNHDYDFVKRDLDNSWKALKRKGIILCDDYERYNGTRRAIQDWAKENNFYFTEIKGKAFFRK